MQIGTHIGIPGLGASPSPGPLPPELTLDSDNSSGAGSGGYAATFTEGGGAVAIADTDTVITDPSGDGIDTCTLTLGGFVDGDVESLTIGGTSVAASSNFAGTGTAGGTTFAINKTGNVITITNNAGGAMPTADLTTLLEAITYNHVGVNGAPILTHTGDQIAALNQTVSFANIANTGGGGTYSATGLPTGLSVNASTGATEGTVDAGVTPGVFTVEVTCTNGAGADSVTYKLRVFTNLVEIDNLDTFPFNANTADCLYLFTEQIDADGTLIYNNANAIGFDFGGFGHTYANDTVTDITNGGFETGDFTGWDTSGASGALVEAGTYVGADVAEGTYAAKLVVPNGETRTLTTTGTVSVESGKGYAITAWWTPSPGDGGGTDVALRLVGTIYEDTDVLRNKQGCIGPYEFVASTTESAAVQVSITNNTGVEQTYYLDRVTFCRSRMHGVVARNADPNNQTPGITTTTEGDDLWITNGTITEGTAVNHDCASIFARSIDSIHVSGFTGHKKSTSGLWGNCFYMIFANAWQVNNCTFRDDSEWIANRESYYGALMLPGSAVASGDRIVTDTRFENGPHAGIKIGGGALSTFGATIQNNVFRMKTKYTNGFAITVTEDADGNSYLVDGNDIDYSTGYYAGRGIFLDKSDNVTVSNNTVIVQERQTNQEYSGWIAGGAWAFEVEGGLAAGNTNVVSSGNTFKVVGNGGGGALRLKDESLSNASFTNDTYEIALAAAPPSSSQSGVCIAVRETALAQATITTPTLKTNYGLIEHNGTCTGELVIDTPTIQYVDDGLSPPSAYFVRGTTSNNTYTLLDPVYADAASKMYAQDPTVTTLEGGTGDEITVQSKQTCTITCQNGSGTPQVGVSVTVKFKLRDGGATIATDTTDGSGQVTVEIPDWKIENQTFTAFTAHIVETDYSTGTYHEITVDENNKTFTLNLDSPDPEPTTHTLTSDKDSYVHGQTTTTNFGSDVDSPIKSYLIQNDSRKIILAFDLSGVTDCDYASLTLIQTQLSGTTDTYEVHGVDAGFDDAWVEGTVTWANAPGNDTSGDGVLDAETTLLGTITQAAGAANGSAITLTSAQSAALATWLASRAGDSQATIWLVRTNKDTATNKKYAMKEHLTYDAPTLFIEEP